MPSALNFATMIVHQQAGRQVLGRTSESDVITDAIDNVTQYDQVMTTSLVLAYAAAIEMVYRARPDVVPERAVDIACGPGHFTLCLARYLGYPSITGIDLSPPMVDIANQNAAKQGLQDRASFQVGDATKLAEIGEGTCGLATFTDAAHHMPDISAVREVLQSMHRITKPDGLVVVMDLVRLRTAALTERYVNLLGHDYIQRGLPRFFDDFRNSMYAAWTTNELREAIPRNTQRTWCHIVPRGLPTIQVIFGLPQGRRIAFVRKGPSWSAGDQLVPRSMRADWRMLRATLAMAAKTFIHPQEV